MSKAAFIQKTFFTNKLDLNMCKKLLKCYIRCVALYGAETWTLWKLHQKLGSFRSTGLKKNGEDWADLVKMMECYLEPRKKGISYTQ